MFPSYWNQSVDLESKSTDWFLYDGNIGRCKIKNLILNQRNTKPNSYTFLRNNVGESTEQPIFFQYLFSCKISER